MIILKNITKNYHKVCALNNVTLTFEDKGLIFIKGKSGCGKTTLLNILGGLDELNEGTFLLDNKDTNSFDSKQWDDYRNGFMGIVFQDFNLIDEMTVYQNLELVLDIQKFDNEDLKRKEIYDTLSYVGLEGFEKRKANQLSGGQKQRVAIARAIVKQPKIILADEPTGNLDSESSEGVLSLLKKTASNKLVIVVTHDVTSAMLYGDRIITINDGQIIDDINKQGIDNYLYNIVLKDTRSKESFKIDNASLSDAKTQITDIIFNNSPCNSTFELNLSVSADDNFNNNTATNSISEISTINTISTIITQPIRAVCPLPFSKNLGISFTNLIKKKFKLIATCLMFSLSLFLLIMASFLYTYDAVTPIQQYISEYDIKEVYLFKNKSYTNSVLEDITHQVTKGELFYKNLKESFPDNVIFPRVYVPVVYHEDSQLNISVANDITCIILSDETTPHDINLLEGKMPENSQEIAITDYVAYWLFKNDSVTDKKITVDNVLYNIVGVIKTDYIEKEILMKFKLGLLNETEQFNLANTYSTIYATEEYLTNQKENMQCLTLEQSNFFISEYENRYLKSSLTFASVDSLNEYNQWTLISGKMPQAENEALISKSAYEELFLGEAYLSSEFAPQLYYFNNIYDDKYNDTYSGSINLFNFYQKGITITGIYENHSDLLE